MKFSGSIGRQLVFLYSKICDGKRRVNEFFLANSSELVDVENVQRFV